VQTYKIIISNTSDPSDNEELNFNQSEMDNLLLYAAPYDESLLRSERDNPNLVDVASISFSIETDGEFYGWLGKYYPEEIYTLMVAAAIKKSVIDRLTGLQDIPAS
jgi:hypothetical protein